MKAAQQKLKQTRKQQGLSKALVASKLGMTEPKVQMLEENPYEQIDLTHTELCSYLKRYGEFLNLKQSDIQEILDHADNIYYENAKNNKPNWIDYLIRLAIAILIVLLITQIYHILKDRHSSVTRQHQSTSPTVTQNLKASDSNHLKAKSNNDTASLKNKSSQIDQNAE